jgi:hypothetical protein
MYHTITESEILIYTNAIHQKKEGNGISIIEFIGKKNENALQ